MTLSIRQPWAWLIAHGFKDIENRTWSTKFRGRFLIHAAKGMTMAEYLDAAEFVSGEPALYSGCGKLPAFDDFERGGIVGEAVITDCVEDHLSPWFVGPFGFVVRDAKPLPFRPERGSLGFFNVPEGVR